MQKVIKGDLHPFIVLWKKTPRSKIMNRSVSWQQTMCLVCTGLKQTERKKDEEEERQAGKKNRQTGKKEGGKEGKERWREYIHYQKIKKSQLNDGQFWCSKSAPQCYRKQQLKQRA